MSAPDLVARLADEVERLRDESDPLAAALLDEHRDQLRHERDEARADVERLRDDLRIAESVNHQCESVDAAIARVVALAEAWETCGMVDAPPTVQYMGELLRRALDGGDQHE